MSEMKFLSWNVNGIRATLKKKIDHTDGFYEWFRKESPDFLCIQETKAHPEQVPKKLLNLEGYHNYWNSGERKGYSGVLTFAKQEPEQVIYDLGMEDLDNEGRLIATVYPKFILCNVYFPNGKKNKERLDYKMRFYEKFLEFIEEKRKEGKAIIFCGDVNTAHKEIDLEHPKANEKISGFLPIERAWIDRVLDRGYIDSFRYINGEKPKQYTWWTMRSVGARERNVGWRLDYFIVSNDLKDKIIDSYILSDIMGSDHCPVGLKIKL